MKIIPDDMLPDKVDEQIEVAPVLKQHKLIATIIDRKQPVLELSILTGEITRPKVESVSDLAGNVKKKVITKDHHLYCQALNEKNAEKHFSRMIRQTAAKAGMWCTDAEWAQFPFKNRVILLKNLMGI